MNKEKIVLITGGARGLGKAIAYKFASLSYNIIINYNKSENEALGLKKELETEYKIKVLTIKADISNEEEVKIMTNKIKEEFGYLTCLVNNASICMDNELDSKTVNEFKKVIDTNLVGTFIVTKYASKLMTTGSIINISSTDAINTCYKEEMDYAASKAGIISLTKTMAKEFAPTIRVNAVAPGWINTDMNKDMSDDFKQKEIYKILLKRFADPYEIANVVCFLDSDDASYINGSIIRVDGGI